MKKKGCQLTISMRKLNASEKTPVLIEEWTFNTSRDVHFSSNFKFWIMAYTFSELQLIDGGLLNFCCVRMACIIKGRSPNELKKY